MTARPHRRSVPSVTTSGFALHDGRREHPCMFKATRLKATMTSPTVCIPSPPPDLDCSDISYRNFRVRPADPHNFDADNDGIGCET